MRVVRSETDLDPAVRGARSEALSAFGDDGIYAEKLMERVRHVEIQILPTATATRSTSGKGVLGAAPPPETGRGSPSVALRPADRDRMGALALEVVRACGYRNAGTVEFLLDENGGPTSWRSTRGSRSSTRSPR